MSFQDVTSVTVYITSFDDFDKFNAVYREVFSTDPPARTTVQVAALIGGARVELQTIAVKPTALSIGKGGESAPLFCLFLALTDGEI